MEETIVRVKVMSPVSKWKYDLLSFWQMENTFHTEVTSALGFYKQS